ncbi:MAG: Exonuclease SbcC [Nitrosopumilales archaeon]|nr:MAG: Exonuclease SbcC [Nitrosopumilales archaeon]
MVKKTKTTKKTKMKSKSKKTKSKSAKNSKNVPLDNNVIVIVDDDLTIDKEKEMEERRAYLEEARSQESSD